MLLRCWVVVGGGVFAFVTTLYCLPCAVINLRIIMKLYVGKLETAGKGFESNSVCRLISENCRSLADGIYAFAEKFWINNAIDNDNLIFCYYSFICSLVISTVDEFPVAPAQPVFRLIPVNKRPYTVQQWGNAFPHSAALASAPPPPPVNLESFVLPNK